MHAHGPTPLSRPHRRAAPAPACSSRGKGGAIGELLSLSARVLIPAWAFSGGDIRFNEALAGGTMMDAVGGWGWGRSGSRGVDRGVGRGVAFVCVAAARWGRLGDRAGAPAPLARSRCRDSRRARPIARRPGAHPLKPPPARAHPPRQGCYCAHALRFFPGVEPSEVISAAPKGALNGCDTGMAARVAYGPPAGGGARLVGRLEADLRHPGLFPVTSLVAEGTRWARGGRAGGLGAAAAAAAAAVGRASRASAWAACALGWADVRQTGERRAALLPPPSLPMASRQGGRCALPTPPPPLVSLPAPAALRFAPAAGAG
jgi:hypothetical protein